MVFINKSAQGEPRVKPDGTQKDPYLSQLKQLLARHRR